MRLLRRAAVLSDRVGDRLYQHRIGVGRAMYLVLRTIDETPGGVLSQQALADRLGLTKAAISRHVAAAEQAGWLTSSASPVSRREHSLALTPGGKNLVNRGLAVQAEYERQTSQQLTDLELTTTIDALTTICDLLEKEESGR